MEGKIESTKHSGGNSDIPEKVERACREDARRETTKLALKYQPVGKQNTSHPKKRREDQVLEES
jgi:hypothetical protein